MFRNRDILLGIATVLLCGIGILGSMAAASWIDKPFPGFLLLENRVVASAGLPSWPETRTGEIYKYQVLAVEGEPLEDASSLMERVSARPIGTPLHYRLQRDGKVMERVIETRRFTSQDFVYFFGSYLLCCVAMGGIALAVRLLARRHPQATGVMICLGLFAAWGLSACDLYGPYRLFRLHAGLECLLFAGTLHLALVFPHRRRLILRRRWLLGVPYALGLLLLVVQQLGLHDPTVYVSTHRLAMTALAVAAGVLIATQIRVYLRPPSFEAHQRVKIVALGCALAAGPPMLVFLSTELTGGRTSENVIGWTGIFFPIAIGYAVLSQNLLAVDGLVRRTLNYALLTGIIALGYVGVLATVGVLAMERAGISQGLFAALFAIFVVTALLPLRDYLQRTTNRLFFRSAYDFEQLVETTSSRLAAGADLGLIADEIGMAVVDALHPEWLALDVEGRTPEETQALLFVGEAPALDPALWQWAEGESWPFATESGGLCVPFRISNRLVALLRLGRRRSDRFYGGDDRRLLHTLSNQGAVAIQNALALDGLRDLNKRLEEKVEERTEELSHTLEELRETQSQMLHQEKMASVGQLVAGIAHEINNPVNFIQGNLHFLREYSAQLSEALEEVEETAGERAPELVSRIRDIRAEHDVEYVKRDLEATLDACDEGIRRTTEIVRGLRTFSRLDDAASSRIDVHESIETSLTLLRSRLRGIELVTEFGQLPLLECLAGQFDQVLMNLLANAADALEGSGRIVIRTSMIGSDRIRVEVEDDGCGIPDALRDRIFEPFYTTKSVGRGTGLGLSILYGIVVRHGGTIRVESEVGRGTRFLVDLPVEFSPAPDPRAGRGPQPFA